MQTDKLGTIRYAADGLSRSRLDAVGIGLMALQLFEGFMKRSLIVCIFVCSAASLCPQDSQKLPDFLKGSWLFHACQAYIRNIDADKSGDAASMNLSMECLDYFQGFTEGSKASATAFCASDATMTDTMVRAYLNYMQAHPTRLDEHRAIGLSLALKDSYPCSKSK
jgi:Rap1a immunity proteins